MQSKHQHDSMQLIVLYRSIYLLKNKFNSYLTTINDIYSNYVLPPLQLSNNIKVIKTAMFPFIVQDILINTKMLIAHINAPSELFMFRYVNTAFQEEQNKKISSEMYDYLIRPTTLRKYKEIYFNKKIEPEIQIKKAKCYGDSNDGNSVKKCVDMVDKEVNECKELMKQKELFYVEMIPMVIADFIMVKGNYVVVNLDEDNKELNEKLHLEFDKKIWSKIIENNTNTNTNNTTSTNTNNNSFINDENTKEQRNNNKMISLLTLTKTHEQQKLNKAINHIFKHYSCKHKATFKSFDEMYNKHNKLFLSEFGSFCKDFNLKLPSHKISEAFKKHSIDNKYITKNDFIQILKYISLYKHKQHIDQLHSKWLSNITNNDIQIQINNLKQQSFMQIFNTFITNDIGVDDRSSYLTKMKGYVIRSNKGFKPVKEKYRYDFRTQHVKDVNIQQQQQKEDEKVLIVNDKDNDNDDNKMCCDYNWSKIENLNVDELELSDKEKEMFSDVDVNNNSDDDDNYELFKNLHLHQIQNESNVTIEGKQLNKNNSNLSKVLITQLSNKHIHNNNTHTRNYKEYSIHTAEQTTFPSIQCKSIDDHSSNMKSEVKCIYKQHQHNQVLPAINNNRSCSNIYMKHKKYITTDSNVLYSNMKLKSSLPSIVNSPIQGNKKIQNKPKRIFLSNQITNTLFNKRSESVSNKTKHIKQPTNIK